MKDFIVKVYDEESESYTNLSFYGYTDIESVIEELTADGWVYVNHLEVE